MVKILRGDRPDHMDVIEKIDSLKKHTRVTILPLGLSDENREIKGVQIKNPNKNPDILQRVMIIAGQHGSEESGRSIALALIDFLLSEDSLAHSFLEQIEFTIVPSCNPDGAQRNSYRNSKDVDIAHVHEFHQDPTSPDALCVWQYAEKYQPELFVDIHGLAGGSMCDRVWMDRQHNFSNNHYFMTKMCEAARDASEKAGFPCCDPKTPDTMTEKSHSKRIGEKLSFLFNTLSFGIEAIENYYTIEEWVPAGLARLKALISFGTQNHFNLPTLGFPNQFIAGHQICGIMVNGKDFAEKRKNRAELTQLLRENLVFVNRNADGVIKRLEVKVFSQAKPSIDVSQYTLVIRLKKPFQIKNITFENQSIEISHINTIDQTHSQTLLIPIKNQTISEKEKILKIEYESKYL